MSRASRCWDETQVGDRIGPLRFPLPLYRLVMAAGANRDFNAIHHNSDVARASGAADAYANYMFLLGMWERALREFAGPAGVLRRVRGLRMKSFNVAGSLLVVSGEVTRKWIEDEAALIECSLATHVGTQLTAGPGSAVVALPRSSAGAAAATTTEAVHGDNR